VNGPEKPGFYWVRFSYDDRGPDADRFVVEWSGGADVYLPGFDDERNDVSEFCDWQAVAPYCGCETCGRPVGRTTDSNVVCDDCIAAESAAESLRQGGDWFASEAWFRREIDILTAHPGGWWERSGTGRLVKFGAGLVVLVDRERGVKLAFSQSAIQSVECGERWAVRLPYDAVACF